MKFIFIGMLVCLATLLPAGTRLSFSGVLGQRAPAGADVVRFTGVNALVGGHGNDIRFAVGARIFDLGADHAVTNRAAVPGGSAVKWMQFDGAAHYVSAANRIVYRMDADCRLNEFVAFPREYRAVCVVPDGLTTGVGAKAKIVAIEDRAVKGWDAAGRSLGTLFELPKTKGDSPFVTIGVLPGSGDVIVGTYYPDCAVYRFTAEGKQVLEKGWPYLRHQQYGMQALAGKLFAFGGKSAIEIKDNMSVKGLEIGDGVFDRGIRGIAKVSSGYYLGTTQGIKFYPCTNLKEASLRIGGLTDVTGLASVDGRILCATQSGTTIRLLADDLPDGILSCDADGIWRINGNWTEQIAGIAPGCGHYFLLGKTSGVWKNDPDAGRAKRWIACDSDRKFASPVALAAAGSDIYVVDDGRVFHAKDRGRLEFKPVLPDALTRIKFVAAQGEALVAARGKDLYLVKDGRIAWEKRGKSGRGHVTGVACAAGCVVVAQGRSVCCYDMETGARVAHLAEADVPGGFSTGALAAQGVWVYVYDAANARIVRLELTKGKKR